MSLFTKTPGLSRARRRAASRRRLIIIAAAVALVALLLILLLVLTRGHKDGAAPTLAAATLSPTPAPTESLLAEADGESAEGLEATPGPTEPPAATSTPDSEPLTGLAAERAATRPTPTAEGFLPIFEKAATEEKIIAITVDDCYQAENLQKIIDIAIANGGKLTIFPIGQNVIREQQAKILKSAWEQGFELENHTYTHSGLYKCSDEELAQQIFTQQLTLCYILDKEYHCHFLRPRGGDARHDQRLQKYAEQMGYYGIAHWSCPGSTSTDQEIARALKPGAIYLFHTTNKDLDKLERFIPWAVQKGYQLVTLNEMFGYPENEVSALESPAKGRDVPPLEPYETAYVSLKKTTYSWMAYLLQEKLISLGYLEGTPDGVYGSGCAEAISNYQRDNGLEVTGVCDSELLESLLTA